MKNMSDRQITEAALNLLRSPDLFDRYLDYLERSGLVGEERNALAIKVTGVSRLLERPMNLIVKAKSSAGKNFVVTRCLRTFPNDAIREITSSSAMSWNYAGSDFRHKIVYLQERNEASGAMHPARLLISENRLVRTVTVMEGGVRIAKTFVAEGPIASISTTTKDQLQIDDETRNISIWIDESQRQTRRIAIASAIDRPSTTRDELLIWRRAHRLLEQRLDKKVVLPGWFEELAGLVWVGDIRVRRYFPAHTTACKVIALLSSFRPERDADVRRTGRIEVTFEDYAIATIIFERIFMDSIHRGNSEVLSTRAAVERVWNHTGQKGVKASDLARELSISKDQAYERMRTALDAGAIRRVNKPETGNIKLYAPARLPGFLPDPEDIFQRIRSLGESFRFIHPLTGELLTGLRKTKHGGE